MTHPPPPLKSKHSVGPTAYEIEAQRRQERNERSRERMAIKRAELRAASYEEQELAAQRSRAYQATYREKNRMDLRIWEAQRRMGLYMDRFGPVAYAAYNEARRDRKRRKNARKAKNAAQESPRGDERPHDAADVTRRPA